MSHFTVLVIGPDHAKQLQPFHEFECTGTADEFVKDIDETDEKREEFATETHSLVKLPSGELVSPYDDRFYRNARPGEETSGGRWGKVRELPAGLVPFEAKFERVEEWAEYHGHHLVRDEEPDLAGEHKFGFVRVKDGAIVKAIRRTNPNKRWDWWAVGGRWSGFLKLNPGAEGSVGEGGVMGSHFARGEDRADQALKRDIDFAGMRDQAGEKAGATWDKAQRITGGLSWLSWDHVRDALHKGDIEAARTAYNTQPAVLALKADDDFSWEIDHALSGPRDAFVQAARDRAISTFAVVHRGEWREKGRMGWFGCSSGDMDQAKWNQLFNELLDGLPDDTLLTVVDCHI